jgi:ATP-dependent Clp protease ATP-binding subunit ClpC
VNQVVVKLQLLRDWLKKYLKETVLKTLSGKRIVSLDMTSIVAGTKYRGQFEERMKVIIEEFMQILILLFLLMKFTL